MRKIFLNFMMIILMIGLTACQTTELVVFEDDIGLPDNISGLYEVKLNNTKKESMVLIIGYINGKYHILMAGDGKEGSGYYKGIIVPSKIPKGKNYYAMSFSNLMFKEFDHNKKTKSKETLDRGAHELLSLKYTDGMIYLYSVDLNKTEQENTELAKKALIKSYTNTFTEKPILKGKKISDFSIDSFNKSIKMIESLDKKYKDYVTKEDVKKIEKYIMELAEIYDKTNNKLAYKFIVGDFRKYNFLKYNKDILKKLIKKNGIFFKLAADELKNNKDFLLEILKINGAIMEFIPSEFKKDDLIRKTALMSNPYYFTHYCDSGFKSLIKTLTKAEAEQAITSMESKQVALLTAKMSPHLIDRSCISHFIEESSFSKDEDVALVAARHGYLFSNFENNKRYIEEYVKSSRSLSYVNFEMKKDKELMRSLLMYAPRNKELKVIKDADYVLEVIKKNQNLLIYYINDELVKSKSFIKKYISQLKLSYSYNRTLSIAFLYDQLISDSRVIFDEDLIKYAILEDAYFGKILNRKKFRNDKGLIITSINTNPYVYFFLDKELRDKEWAKEIVTSIFGNIIEVDSKYFIGSRNNCSDKNKEFVLNMFRYVYAKHKYFKGFLLDDSCFKNDPAYKSKIKQYVIPYPVNLQEWAKIVNNISPSDFWPPIEIQKDIIKIVGGE